MGQHVVLGAGPVARAVVASLVSRGIDASVVSRSGTEVAGAKAVRCDALDTAALTRVVSGADAVYQSSQPEYHRWVKEFPPLQQSIVSAVRGSSTVLVAVENLYGYGPVGGALTEDLPLSARTRKGKVRAAMWRELEAQHSAGNIRATAGRASDFFGPYAAGSWVGDRFFQPLLKGGKAEMMGKLGALHSYTYVADFGEALVRLALDERSLGRAWHVPNAPAVTNGEFLARAAAAAGTEPRSVIRGRMQLAMAGLFIPPARETIEMLYELEEDFVVDHSAYARVFGDHATPLEQSIPATVEWWRTHGASASH
jgi:nucleoside-diphosphate-sugar epimerase